MLAHTHRVTEDSVEVHVQRIPDKYRTAGVCVGWRTYNNSNINIDTNTTDITTTSPQCWGLDNIALTTSHTSTQPLSEDFDPFDPSDWMFFPGATIKVW